MEHTLDYKSPPKFSTYRKRHSDKFDSETCISEEEFSEIAAKECFYCGIGGPNGIDRIDSTKGYEQDNCTPCCKHCNYVKGNLSLEDFNTWKDRLVQQQIKLNKARNRKGDDSLYGATKEVTRAKGLK